MTPTEILMRNLQRTIPEATVVETPLPLCPELRLYLINPYYVKGPFSEREIATILDNTPFWAFCWPGGHALASCIVRNRELVRDKIIVDFGSGAGVVALAAVLAGAAKVVACDLDPDAVTAIAANATLNHAEVSICNSFQDVSGPIDLIIAADVLYDRENLPLLNIFLSYAPEVLVAESRLPDIDIPPYQKLAEIHAPPCPDDGGDGHKRVVIYRGFQDVPREKKSG
jgi:predicted nicotinamide N-methyase